MIELPKRIRPNIDAQINIVPYIDVMLVLLVIFMMTTPIIEQGIDVDLPAAEAQMVDFTEQQPTIITINRAGEYFINSMADEGAEVSSGERLSLGRIAARVQARLQVFPQMKVFVRGDREVAYGSVISLMSFLQKNGVEKVGIVTESPDAK
ncbi:MAG TPA: protein TolR [Gammaproteobacteria bacterium]|jgi:biopolymer transport protein TolR|uniref:Tol biopolymer transport system, TolR protein n=1 Tax=hydrothermal vent metagenome TaxID=652676 RepID=A0A1W1DT38_9ZZZZ|nr:MAG: protein TolR [Candidatus Thioglobus sp.]HAD98871.1 protein TolR [Gammaproteobacteria bacterium]RUM77593.1 MAG: protein TolR [Candidatus Thioglobus sp.]RUM81901.1 MAG: protein TolR [Candidatus Thioglobus sp.]RUM82542.1 MAG: protein TolR [Candidatus Thioglobus sp.]